jgi:hypothetical protein
MVAGRWVTNLSQHAVGFEEFVHHGADLRLVGRPRQIGAEFPLQALHRGRLVVWEARRRGIEDVSAINLAAV